ncbi:MAG: hypothetical protein JNG88_07625 [Phycisphaerales bacterium]|nr:hypothetical protein [Phycisphaerales bacterium]
MLAVCGLSLLLLLAATEKVFPALNAPRESVRGEQPIEQSSPDPANPSKDSSERPRVVLGPIYPDMLGRSVCTSASHSDRMRDSHGKLSLIEWPAYLLAQNIVPALSIDLDAPRWLLEIASRPLLAQFESSGIAELNIQYVIVRTGPPRPFARA